jgi:hypothetical protein
MNYTYISNEPIDIQQIVDVNGTPKLRTVVNCVSGIVGDTYGFQKIDKLTLYTDITLTITQTQASITQQCTSFVTTTYPNT